MCKSRIDILFEKLISGETSGLMPRSRTEKILLSMIEGKVPDMKPRSRLEAYLIALAAKGTAGAEPKLQEKTATANGDVIPDEGYDGLSKVTVNVSGGTVEEYDGSYTLS